MNFCRSGFEKQFGKNPEFGSNPALFRFTTPAPRTMISHAIAQEMNTVKQSYVLRLFDCERWSNAVSSSKKRKSEATFLRIFLNIQFQIKVQKGIHTDVYSYGKLESTSLDI